MLSKGKEICALLRKSKRTFYAKLNPSLISDNKKFWKIVKPFFSDKVSTISNISLPGNDILHDNDTKVAEIFGNFFSNTGMDPNLVSNDIIDENAVETDPVIVAVNKYDKHRSILKIKEFVLERELFSLFPIDIVKGHLSPQRIESSTQYLNSP